MAHAQKPYFVFRRKVRVHLNRQGASVQWTAGSRGVRISGSNAGYTTFRGSVKSTDHPLYSPVSPLLSLPCLTVCHHISTGLYSLGRIRSGVHRNGGCFGEEREPLPLTGIKLQLTNFLIAIEMLTVQ